MEIFLEGLRLVRIHRPSNNALGTSLDYNKVRDKIQKDSFDSHLVGLYRETECSSQVELDLSKVE